MGSGPVVFALSILAVLAGCSTAATTSETLMVPSHAMVFEMDGNGAISPYAYYLRDRYLEPKSEQEIAAVLASERATPPVRKGHVAVRARNRWGKVIYRTLVEVVLMGETICCPHVPFRQEELSLSVVVPATAASVSFEGWQPASRVTLKVDAIKSASAHRDRDSH